MAVVVFPDPPFGLTIPITRGMAEGRKDDDRRVKTKLRPRPHGVKEPLRKIVITILS
jgi:hypothetical protein